MRIGARRLVTSRLAPLMAVVLASACASDAAESAVISDDTGPSVDVPVGCSADSECAVPNVCIVGTCASGKCQFEMTTDTCDDGNACTADDICRDGACVAGRVVSCDDGLVCTSDSCDLLTGCVNAELSGPCSDGDACTTGDQCAAGTCAGSALACDDGNPCTSDGCDSKLGCTHTPAPGACDDGNACTASDACSDGTCAGTAVLCDDEDPCTADGCDAASGCFTTPSPDAPACGALSCDPSTLGPNDPKPVCPEAACTPVCEPVDPETCVVVGGVYRCDAPACSCGDTQKAVACTLPPPQAVCDPVCEPPKCVTACANDVCGNESCPVCESICTTPTCASKCQQIENSGACGSVFGCALTEPGCTATCNPADCGWVNYDDSASSPTCEANDPAMTAEQPGIAGAFCGADGSATPKAWGVVCKNPECEIKCTDEVLLTCSEPANCAVDCTTPVCSVTCDAPVCAKDAATGLLTCEPPANCVTTCQCAIGTCTRAN